MRRTASAKETIAYLRAAVEREKVPPAKTDVIRLSEAVGIDLPGVARRRLEDVEAFHAFIVENRRARIERDSCRGAGGREGRTGCRIDR